MKKISVPKKIIKYVLIAEAALILVSAGVVVSFSQPSPVQTLKVDSSTYSSTKLSWDEVEDADGYRVFRSENGGELEYIESTVSNSFEDRSLRTGTKYSYVVAARNGFKRSEIDKKYAVEIVPSLDEPTLKINTNKGKMELDISPVDGAIAYEIIRDGKSIGQSKEAAFVDETAEHDKAHEYEVRAVRYIKNPVYSSASNSAKAELHGIPNVEMTADADNITINWDSSEHYDNYKVYKGEELLTETTDTEYTVEGYETAQIYDIKLEGFSSEEKVQSPTIKKRIKVEEQPMDNDGAKKAACDWAIMIANDDSFAYGTGDTAHRCGCYFCGTNRSKKGSGYDKTYCCNPFVHAAYAHGAGDPQMLRTCQRGGSVGMSASDYTHYGNWYRVSKPPASELEAGDALVGEDHVMIYVGDGMLAHACTEGWGANTILVEPVGRNYGFCDFVMRYTGTGSGTMYKVKEVDEKGNVIEEKEPEKENEEDSKEES